MKLSGECLTSTDCVVIANAHSCHDAAGVVGHLKLVFDAKGFTSGEGRRHSIYRKGRYRTQIPRHTEIVDELARKICRDLSIPFLK